MKTIKFNTVIGSITCKKDGSLGLRLETPELSPVEKVEILKLQNMSLDATLEPLEANIIDTLRVDKDIDEKTPSQRLRAVFYRLWEQEKEKHHKRSIMCNMNGDTFEIDYESYYRRQMEKLIEHFKSKLENKYE